MLSLMRSAVTAPAMGYGAKPLKMSLTPTVKHTGQESANCAKFSNFNCICSRNLYAMSANCRTAEPQWGTESRRPPEL